MSPTTWLLIAMAAWIGFGTVQALFLGRRGFDGISWFLIGMVLGPLSVLVAWNCIRRDEQLQPTVVRPGRSGPGLIDVLIGFDGSAEAHAAMSSVGQAFGGRLRRVALAAVLHYDDPPEHEHTKLAELEAAGRTLRGVKPELLVVRGHPATALAEEARLGRYHVIAIGTTGHGHAHLFGSTAKELVQRSTVPVLVCGQHVAAAVGAHAP